MLHSLITAYYDCCNSYLYYALIVFVLFDILLGLTRAIKDKKLNSKFCLQGMIKQFLTLAFPILVYPLFDAGKMNWLNDMIILAFILPNLLSVFENFERLGIHLPDELMKFFDNYGKK